jgi:segregation and condensation protein B
MEISEIIPHIEALIFASDKALNANDITELINTALGFIEDRADVEQIEAAINGIKEKYDTEFYAFELKQSGGGWQFLTKPAYHKTVSLINGDKFLKRLSTASLETLSIIAYKQPITKSEIESIRGVNCDYAVQKLLEKDLVIISGRNEDAVGKPLIYATSKSFMDYFGINSAAELPTISEVFNEEINRAQEVSQLVEDQEKIAAENNTEVVEVENIETEEVEMEAAQSGNEDNEITEEMPVAQNGTEEDDATAENKDKQEVNEEEAS